VFHKVLFFAPLGALLAWWVVGLPWLWRSYAAAASMMFILAAALAIELGQVLLPSKYPDTTDWFLESLGGILGYLLFRLVWARLITGSRKRGQSGAVRRHRHGEGTHASR
jgi:glycopeptide antibiotics resistance protein